MVIKSSPQILERVSIRWLPEPLFEDTETVALNVGGYFMDLRVALKDRTLVWSRAGQRIKIGENPLTFQWTRIIDSTGSKQVDEASFAEMTNGDDLEFGNFSLDGILKPYEEVWRDITPPAEPNSLAWILQSTCGTNFIGKIGRIFIGMQQSLNGTFAARKEELDESIRVVSFDSEPSGHFFDQVNIPLLESELRSRKCTAGCQVDVSGCQYIVRGLEELGQYP